MVLKTAKVRINLEFHAIIRNFVILSRTYNALGIKNK